MRREPFPERDGMMVWLSDDELQELLSTADGKREQVALLLMGRCGLRRSEVVGITPSDVTTSRSGRWLRVRSDVAKFGKYREVPIPENLANYLEMFGELEVDPDDPVVDVVDRTVYRWVRDGAEELQEETGDVGWADVTPHDLRRTWATRLLEDAVLPTVVMSWGGWEDFRTFFRHYLGEFSPEGLRRERGKVSYLEGDDVDDVDPTTIVPIGSRQHSTGD